MSGTADPQPGAQVPGDDDGGGARRPVWIPDVVSLGSLGSGWDDMPKSRAWVGW